MALLILSILSTSTYSADDCAPWMGKIFRPPPADLETVPFVVRAGLFPLYAPVFVYGLTRDTLRAEGARGAWKIPLRFVHEQGWAGTLSLALYGLVQATSINYDQMEAATREFDKMEEGDLYVIVANDAVDPSKRFEAEARAGRANSPGRKLVLSPGSAEELVQGLKDIVAKHGPIKRLEFLVHSNPAGMRLGKTFANQKSLDAVDPERVMAPGGKIRFMSCSLGDGEVGESFLRTLGAKIMPDGGTIYAPRVTIFRNLTADIDSEAYPRLSKVASTYEDMLLGPIRSLPSLAFSVGNHSHYGTSLFKLDRVHTLEIGPAN
jgi:hypothetical protein